MPVKWEGRTTAAASIWEERAKSREAEENYATGVERAVRLGLRLKGLDPITARNFADAVRGMGRIWSEKAAARRSKWEMKFKPYLEEIKRIVPTLAPRVPGEPRTNVINRVAPIAEGLAALKEAGVGGGGGYSPPVVGGYGGEKVAGPKPIYFR